MIAVIRCRFTPTPASAVWSDAVMNNWMNPTIPYSLAHFWTRTSLFQADMRYILFPPIVIDDPRPNTPPKGDPRQTLVDGVTAEVTRAFRPDWSIFDRIIVVFAQQTDLFGGGAYLVPVSGGQKLLPAAVCDNLSPFSDITQEVGHAFGLNHEVDDAGNEYRSPYSSMSSEGYGGATSSFERPVDARFPQGTPTPAGVSAVITNDVQRIIGPYIAAAQFSLANFGSFNDPGTVIQVPASYANAPETFRLTAVDAAIDSWPVRKHLLAILPSVQGGDRYCIELRRNHSYDAGLTTDGSNGAPVAVVIHATHPVTGRVRYVNRLPLMAAAGDRDYHCFAGHFTLRLNSFSDDLSSCSVTVGGNEFWKYFGVDLSQTMASLVPHDRFHVSPWHSVDVSPCFMFPKAPHQYRYHFQNTQFVFSATSFGYEKPNYQWFINDQLLHTTSSNLIFNTSVRTMVNGEQSAPFMHNVNVAYVQTQNSIRLTFADDFVDVSATIKVVVNESSVEVLQNLYPDRSVWTGISFSNVTVEWDQTYQDDQAACGRRLKDIASEYARQVSQVPPHRPDPGPEFGVNVVRLIDELMLVNPTAANAVINEVARLGNVGKLEIIKKLR